MNMKWNKDVENRILRKSRFALTFRIVRVLIVAVIVFLIYSGLLDLYGNSSRTFEKAHFYNELAIEWTTPNIRSRMPSPTWEVNLFGVGEITYPLFRRVGNETIAVGEAKITKAPFSFLSKKEVEMYGEESNHSNDFTFYYGVDPQTGEQLETDDIPETWQTLEMLPEGTVGELAFSLEEMMTPEQLAEMLGDYDIGFTWMALYTGEYQEGSSIQETSMEWAGGRKIMASPTSFGLTPEYDKAEDFMSSGFSWFFGARWGPSVIDTQNTMLKNMEKILAESVSYQKDFLGLPHLQERYDYIQENGFVTFGAVVTGPVKELLKLQDVEGIHSPMLGEVELWNWDQPQTELDN